MFPLAEPVEPLAELVEARNPWAIRWGVGNRLQQAQAACFRWLSLSSRWLSLSSRWLSLSKPGAGDKNSLPLGIFNGRELVTKSVVADYGVE